MWLIQLINLKTWSVIMLVQMPSDVAWLES